MENARIMVNALVVGVRDTVSRETNQPVPNGFTLDLKIVGPSGMPFFLTKSFFDGPRFKREDANNLVGKSLRGYACLHEKVAKYTITGRDGKDRDVETTSFFAFPEEDIAGLKANFEAVNERKGRSVTSAHQVSERVANPSNVPDPAFNTDDLAKEG